MGETVPSEPQGTENSPLVKRGGMVIGKGDKSMMKDQKQILAAALAAAALLGGITASAADEVVNANAIVNGNATVNGSVAITGTLKSDQANLGDTQKAYGLDIHEDFGFTLGSKTANITVLDMNGTHGGTIQVTGDTTFSGDVSAKTVTLGGQKITLDQVNTYAGKIDQAAKDVASNKDMILTNGKNIGTLTTAVHNNSVAIVDVKDMAVKGIDKANAEIHTNAGNIAQNKLDIATNKDMILTNGENIGKLTTAVQQNSNAIVDVAKTAYAGIDKANAEIHTNAGNIAQNKLDIAANKEAIANETTARTKADAALQKNIDTVNQTVTAQGQQLGALSSRVNKLDGEIDNVGALSAALAGLHPLDYEGGSKFQISAAVGTYDGTQAGALGAFYHASKDVLVSLAGSTSFGGDSKAAANLGVTFRVGQSGEVEKADTATIEKLEAEIEALKAEVAALKK